MTLLMNQRPEQHASRDSPLRKHYGFEEIIRPKDAALFDENDNYYDTFRDNLGLKNTVLSSGATKLLRRYVAVVHINACWYNTKVQSQTAWQFGFFIASVVLLLVTPITIYCLPPLLETKWNVKLSTEGEVTGLLSTLLAGFYGAHRAISSWFSQRKLIAPYWKARSELMDEIYTLETKWRPETKTCACGSLSNGFRDAILASLVKAREVVEKERETFFENYSVSVPEIDIEKQLVARADEASRTVLAFTSRSTTRRRKQTETIEGLLADQRGLATARTELEQAISEKTEDLNKYTAGSDEYKQRNAKLGEMRDTLERIIDAQSKNTIDLAKARARLG